MSTDPVVGYQSLRSVSIFIRLMQENASTSRINSADAQKSSIWILANRGDSKRKDKREKGFETNRGDRKPLQDGRLPSIALILLKPFPALFLPVPPQFAGIRAGGAHTGHMNRRD